MSLGTRRPELVLSIAVVLLWGCGSNQPVPSSTHVAKPAVPTVSPAAVPTTPPAGSPAAPSPTSEPVDPFLNQVVVIVSDRLRVRSEPRVSDDSEKYEPVLPLGTELAVLDGPVRASGYTWWKVTPVSFDGLEGPGYGWVAMAGIDGEPWIAVRPADCPPIPTDVRTLARLPLLARVACFSGRPITVEARLIECNCDVDGGGYHPAWFGWGHQPLLLVEPSETRPAYDSIDWLIVMLDPAGRHPGLLPVGQVVEVTGMFDHPAALTCLFQDIPVEIAGPPAPTSDCRFMFATTSLVAAKP